jgi:hypothetical protein
MYPMIKPPKPKGPAVYAAEVDGELLIEYQPAEYAEMLALQFADIEAGKRTTWRRVDRYLCRRLCALYSHRADELLAQCRAAYGDATVATALTV